MAANARPARAAFTMIEVMMASAILVVAFIGLIQAVTIGAETLDTARKQQVATQLIATEIERLRAGSWTTIANLPASATIAVGTTGGVTGDEADFAVCNFTAANGDDDTALLAMAKGFTCAFSRTYLRPTGATAATATYIKFVYTVSWTSNTGRAYSRTMETYFGMNGLHLSFQQS